MNLAIKNYLEEVKNSNKLISLKDEVNTIFENEKEAKQYYFKILNIVNSSKIKKEKIYQVIHIRQADLIKVLEKIQESF